MPRVPRQVWLVSLAVIVIVIMAFAASYAAKPVAQHAISNVNQPIGPAVLSVGAVATVEVNRKTGALRATHFAIVHDCGQVINPKDSA